MSKVAIIGGTGADLFPVGADVSETVAATDWGQPSAPLLRWEQSGHEVLFLRRHGVNGTIPPHRVNYRANIQSLKNAGADVIVALNAVGGIAPDAAPGKIVLPSQLVDYTWGREHTFYDGSRDDLEFVDFTDPFDPDLRRKLLAAGGPDCIADGVYAVTQGPRLETAAEIDALERAGCTIVGMTAMPEAGLACEAGLSYASVCHVVNYAAGRSETDIHAQFDSHLQAAVEAVSGLIDRFLADF